MMTEVQYRDAQGKWQKLPIPSGVSINEPKFAFDQCRSRGLTTRVIKWKPDGSFDITAGPFAHQRR